MSNAKRLAKNTMYMYIRMLVLMVISLYTSRVLLQQLGIEDYGIYNVVGSIVVMFNSLRGIFASSTQRFLNIEMGKDNGERMNTIFNMSLRINLLISIVFIICVEALGLWFINFKINIEPSRIVAAHWVFQFSVLSAVIALLTTPYDAIIIANERMGFYAGMSVFEGAAKLGIIFLLSFSPFDKLISYGFLLLVVQVLIRCINAGYCRKCFAESRLKKCWDKELFKDMGAFAGWNFLANTGYTLSNEGINMLLNVFGGPVVNAARGITYQVKAAIEQFLHSVNKATDPFAMKLFARGDMREYYYMMFTISKVLAFVYTCIGIPLFFYTGEVLQLWLGQVPEYTVIFIRIILIHGIIRSFFPPLNVLFYAANKVKWFQIRSLFLSVMTFLSAWLVLRQGMPYESAFIVMVIIMAISYLIVLIQAKVLCNFPLKEYLRNVLLPVSLVLSLCALSAFLIRRFVPTQNYFYLVAILLIILVCLAIVLMIGLNNRERHMLKEIISR